MAIGEEVADAYIEVHADTTAVRRDLARLQASTNKILQKVGADAEDMGDSVNKGFDRANRGPRLFIGRLKGARNDFVNIIGVMGGAIERFADKVVTGAFRTGGKALERFGDALTRLGGDSGPLAAVGGKLNELGTNLGQMGGKGGWVGAAVSIAVVGVALASIVPVLAVVSTSLSALLGIITALAGSAFFAVSGALLALGPIALAAAAGVGALVTALAGMTEEQEALFDPLKKNFKVIKDAVTQRLFANLGSQLEGLNGILNNFVGPLLSEAAGALSTVFDDLIAGLNSPEVQATLGVFRDTLPPILQNMGLALNDFLLGMLNFFAPISEAMVPISESIANIAEKFRAWTEKPENAERIGEFFDAAVVSLTAWKDLIGPISDAVLALFTDGKDTGDSFVLKIAEIIQKFADWASDEANREKIATWFQDAKTIAGQLADGIKTVGEMIVKLDTPENRKALQILIVAFTAIAGAVSTVIGLINGLINALSRIVVPAALKTIASLAGGVKDFLGVPPGMAAGGIVTSPTYLAGEAGKEMVVPLVRPLNQVDPSVRAVSAFARGMTPAGTAGTNPAGKVVNIHEGAVQVTAATANEEQVANAVLDRLVARWK